VRKLLAVVALAAAATGCGGSKTAAPASPTLPKRYGTDFALRDQSGRLVRLSAQRGKVVLVTFLYVHCPDVCPLIASNLNAALGRLGARAREVRVLAVSVDPRGDPPPAVRRFVARHHLRPEFRYLTGTRAQLAPVWRAYGIAQQQGRGTAVGHSAVTFLLDRRGRPKYLYPPDTGPAVVTHDVRVLLS
jgi:protein SCO1/2